ncbi:hypothetical protein RFI_10790, partial [Reticulomyxa filosa]
MSVLLILKQPQLELIFLILNMKRLQVQKTCACACIKSNWTTIFVDDKLSTAQSEMVTLKVCPQKMTKGNNEEITTNGKNDLHSFSFPTKRTGGGDFQKRKKKKKKKKRFSEIRAVKINIKNDVHNILNETNVASKWAMNSANAIINDNYKEIELFEMQLKMGSGHISKRPLEKKKSSIAGHTSASEKTDEKSKISLRLYTLGCTRAVHLAFINCSLCVLLHIVCTIAHRRLCALKYHPHYARPHSRTLRSYFLQSQSFLVIFKILFLFHRSFTSYIYMFIY